MPCTPQRRLIPSSLNAKTQTTSLWPADAQMKNSKTYAIIVLLAWLAYPGLVNGQASTENGDYNIRSYGATGDGTTDDSTAIQNAINAAIGAGGGRVYVPAGVYLINAKLRIVGNYVSFVGGGPASVIQAGSSLPAGGRGYMLEVLGPSHDVDVSHLFFQGRGGGANDPAGVHAAAGTYRIQAHHCRFYNLGYYGGVDFSSSYFGMIHDNFSLNCWKGISVSGTVPDNGIVVTSNVIQDCNVAIALEFGRNIVVSNNSIEYTKAPGSFGIQVLGTDDVLITNNTLYAPKNTSGNGITLGPESTAYGNAQRARILGNSITGFAYGIRVETMTDGIIRDNTLKGQSLTGIMLDLSNSTTRNPSARNMVSGNVIDVAAGAKAIAETTGGGDYNIIDHNRLLNASSGVFLNGANSRARENIGYLTENDGVTTISSGTTTISVSHGLSRTPSLTDISVTATNNLGRATKFWISSITASTFQINVDSDPGPSSATFAWAIAER